MNENFEKLLNNADLPSFDEFAALDEIEFNSCVNKALYSFIQNSNVEGKKILELAKKLVFFNAKKFGYENIDTNTSIDVLQLFKNMFQDEMYFKEYLPDFEFSFLCDKKKLSEYINKLIYGKTHDELEYIINCFDSIGRYFNYQMFSAKVFIEDNLYNLLFSTLALENDDKQNQDNNFIISDFDEPDENPFADVPDIIIENDDKRFDEHSEEMLNTFLSKINTILELQTISHNFSLEMSKIKELYLKKIMDWFYSDQDFINMLTIILKHDTSKNAFYFHGAQFLDDAPSIMNLGLGMTQDSLDSTAQKELDINQVLLYRYGLHIGKEAVVIIDVPLEKNGKEINIVEKKDDNIIIPFVPSGNQGLEGKAEYIVDSKYIVGYIDKKNREVIFNPKYIHYDLFEDIDKKKRK